jgi:nucleoside-diphosphate-sugar epimerase
MTRLLITGAAGFIGSQVAELALADGHEVVGIDNLNDAYDVRLKHWRLARLEGRPGFEFHRVDVTDRAVTEGLIGGRAPFDAVVHLAARAGVRPSVTDPWTYFDTNSTGTLNVLEACRRYGVPKFVLSSTSSLYGRHNPLPYDEDADTNRPLSPYAASKKAAEATAYTYHHLHGLDVTVLRYFTVYGPAGRPDMSLFRFVQWVAEDRPVIIMGDGRQSRDFTYVEDIARGTLAALRPLGFEVVNLGSDRPVVLLDVLAHVEQLLGKRARIEYRPSHPADVPATWASIDRAKVLLDWKPTTDWQDGIAALVSWYVRERNWAREIVTDE